jgi:hypothetical protein
MNAKIETGILLTLALATGIGLGCGDDDDGPDVGGPVTVEIRNGTWTISETVSYTGADSCLARPDTTVDSTGVICNVTLGQDAGPAEINCELDTDEQGQVEFRCTFRTDLGFCWHLVTLIGEGAVTDTTFDLSSMAFAKVQAKDRDDQASCDLLFGTFVDACTTLIDFSGSWISSEGDTLCPPDTAAEAGVPLESLLHRMTAVKAGG